MRSARLTLAGSTRRTPRLTGRTGRSGDRRPAAAAQPPPCRTGDHDRDAARRQHAATEALRRHRRLTAPRTPQLSGVARVRSEEHTSELQSLMRTSYAVFCLKKKKTN